MENIPFNLIRNCSELLKCVNHFKTYFSCMGVKGHTFGFAEAQFESACNILDVHTVCLYVSTYTERNRSI